MLTIVSPSFPAGKWETLIHETGKFVDFSTLAVHTFGNHLAAFNQGFECLRDADLSLHLPPFTISNNAD